MGKGKEQMEKPSEPREPGLLLLYQPMGCGVGWKEWRKHSYYWDVGLGVLDIPCILTMSSLVVAAAAIWVSRVWENRQNRQLLCWLQQPAALGSIRVCCCSRARRKQPKQGAGCSHLCWVPQYLLSEWPCRDVHWATAETATPLVQLLSPA